MFLMQLSGTPIMGELEAGMGNRTNARSSYHQAKRNLKCNHLRADCGIFELGSSKLVFAASIWMKNRVLW